MNFTPEQITKAKAAKSAEELIALAKENGMELSEEEAAKYFAELNKEGELADEELDNVSGGACYSSGVWGPNGYQKYAVVSPLSFAEECWKNGIRVIPCYDYEFADCCYQCCNSFVVGATWYCAERWEGHDPLD